MPPKHRPVAPLPRALQALTRLWWAPVMLFWVVVFGGTYLAWSFK